MSLTSDRMMKLMAYTDGELEGVERLEVESWLVSDMDAVRFANELAGLGDLVKTGHRASPTGKSVAAFDIADTVMATVHTEKATPARVASVVSLESRRQKNLKIGGAVAAALALAASIFLLARPKAEVPIALAPRAPVVAPAPLASAESDVDVDVNETDGESVRVFYLANESSPTTTVVVWVDEPGGK